MNTPCNLPYFELEIDKEGSLVDPNRPEPITSFLAAHSGIKNLFVMAHGWNNTIDEARDLYRRFFTQFCRTLAAHSAPGVAAAQCAVTGVLWPSEKFADAGELPGGSAAFDPDGTARELLNLTTYYLMKNRAGLVGRRGLAETVDRIRAAVPSVRIHLIGHSFGCRVITSAASAIADPVDSMTLLQAAFSHNAFSPDYDSRHRPGFFRSVVTGGKCRGPMMITHSFHDRAVGIGYAIASRIARQNGAAIGDAGDPYGGLGRSGARNTPEAADGELLPEGAVYSLTPGGIFNLNADDIISSHDDVVKPETAWALIAAAGLATGA